MNKRWLRFVSVFMGLLISSVMLSTMGIAKEKQHKAHKAPATSKVTPAKHGLEMDGTMNISPSDRCPVCAMNVKKHAKFAAAIELENGETHYFCGTGCMIRTWLHPEVFLNVDKKQLKRAVVKDYFTGKPLDAMQAYWVAGSDVIGPMGPALVPLKAKPTGRFSSNATVEKPAFDCLA